MASGRARGLSGQAAVLILTGFAPLGSDCDNGPESFSCLKTQDAQEHGAALNVIDVGIGVVQLAPDGIIEIRLEPGSVVEVPEMERILAAQLALLGDGVPVLVLADARPVRSMTRAAQVLSAESSVMGPQSAVAILVKGPLSLMIGKLFMTVNTPDYPAGLFRSEAEARAWLLSLEFD